MNLIKPINPLQKIQKLADTGEINLLNSLTKSTFYTGSVNITIRKIYTDVDGSIIDKSVVPLAMQKRVPVYTLSNFDRTGGYNIGQKLLPAGNGLKFVATYAQGVNLPIALFNQFNEIQNYISPGDIVTVYTDDILAPNYFCFIIQAASQGGLCSIISNTQTIQDDGRIGKLIVQNINLNVDNEGQWQEDWRVVLIDNAAVPVSKVVNLTTVARPPQYTLRDYITIPIRFDLTQYIGIYFYMSYESDLINFNLKIGK